MCLSLGDTASKGFMEAVNFILVVFLLIYSTLVKRKFLFVSLFLLIVHFAFKFPEQGIGYGFQTTFGFPGLFHPFGMFAVVSVSNQLFTYSRVTLAMLDLLLTGDRVALVNDLFAQLGIGRKGGVVLLDGRV